MNLGQMRLEVRRAIDELTADLWSDAELNAWINEGAKLMTSNCQQTQAIFQKTLTSGQQEYVLPDDVDEIFSVYLHNNSSNYPLKPIKPSGGQLGSASSGTPGFFYTRYNSLHTGDHVSTGITVTAATLNQVEPKFVLGLFPVPDSAMSLTIFYFSRHYEMKHDGAIPMVPLEFRRGIVAYATALAKEKEMAYAEADRKRQEFKDFSDRLKEKMISEGHEMGFPCVSLDDETVPIYGDIVIKFGTMS